MAKLNKKILWIIGIISKTDKKESSVSVATSFIDKYTSESCSGGGCSKSICNYVDTGPSYINGFNLNELNSLGSFGTNCQLYPQDLSGIIICGDTSNYFNHDVLMINIDSNQINISCETIVQESLDRDIINGDKIEYDSTYKGIKLYHHSECVDGVCQLSSDKGMAFCSRNNKFLIVTIDYIYIPKPTCAEVGGTCCAANEVCSTIYFEVEGGTTCGSPCCAGTCTPIPSCLISSVPITLSGNRLFNIGISLPEENVRIIKGDIPGEGQPFVGTYNEGIFSLNNGVFQAIPNIIYLLLFGYGSTNYYTLPMGIQIPCISSMSQVGTLCLIDKVPTITVFDEYGSVQSSGIHNQIIGPMECKEVTVRVKTAADKCYGSPNTEFNNQICFMYDEAVYSSVSVNPLVRIPSVVSYSISTHLTPGKKVECFNLPILADTGYTDVPVDICSISNPTSNNNIAILLEDTNPYITNQLELKWGFEDASNNNLGSPLIEGGFINVE